MQVCPSGAIIRDEDTEAVVVVSDHCVGCKMCMLACPFGQIYYNTREKVSSKCDLCKGDPNCVKHCISGALEFEQEEEAFHYKRELFDARLQAIMSHHKNRERIDFE
jgi:Fe-S-cluster-containing hydrogenase component 2